MNIAIKSSQSIYKVVIIKVKTQRIKSKVNQAAKKSQPHSYLFFVQ